MPEALVDVSLEKKSDDGSGDEDRPTGDIKATVTDTNNQTLEATVEATADDGSTSETKQTGSIGGMCTFQDVPITDYTVTISASDYQSKTVQVKSGDFE